MAFQLPTPSTGEFYLPGFSDVSGETKPAPSCWSGFRWPSTEVLSHQPASRSPNLHVDLYPVASDILSRPRSRRHRWPGPKSFGFFLAQGTALGIFIQPRKNQPKRKEPETYSPKGYLEKDLFTCCLFGHLAGKIWHSSRNSVERRPPKKTGSLLRFMAFPSTKITFFLIRSSMVPRNPKKTLEETAFIPGIH